MKGKVQKVSVFRVIWGRIAMEQAFSHQLLFVTMDTIVYVVLLYQSQTMIQLEDSASKVIIAKPVSSQHPVNKVCFSIYYL